MRCHRASGYVPDGHFPVRLRTVMSVPADTSTEEVTRVIAAVAAKAQEWHDLDYSVKLGYLAQIRNNLEESLDAWMADSSKGHGYDISNPAHGHLVAETLLKGPCVFGSWINSFIEVYTALAKTGKPPAPMSVRKTPSGHVAATVFPANIRETIFGGGLKAEVYLESDKVEQTLPADSPAGLVGVLCAGNFEAPTDVLHVLFLQNQVAVAKSNPVNAHVANVIARIYQPLIAAGYLAYVHGGVDVGKTLTSHPAVDRLLLTGSCKSYDVIMWGVTEAERQANKKAGTPLFTKPFDAELGSVNPYIIVPGTWSDSELEAHAQQLASFKMFNDSHICASPQVIITAKSWPQREKFLNRVRELLTVYPGTRAYYPHCEKSYAQNLEVLGGDTVCKKAELFPGKQLNPLFATNLPQDHFLTQNEAFCPVLGEIALDAPTTTPDFLAAAVKFANTSCWGSLTVTLIVDPRVQKANKVPLEQAVDDLKFGAISINHGAINHPIFGQLNWGAYPRHPAEDIQSGAGKIGNCYLFKHATKCVTWGPFTHPGQFKIPSDAPARLKRDQIFARYSVGPSMLRLTRLLAVVLTGL
eukprot:m.225149 g.225149  ORF g.225149 m.225149 type:complete len:584 (-) comp11221_c0_seq1:43-1794(-)